MINSYNFYNKITSFTRITPISSTIIDHLYFNNKTLNLTSTILINDISDHFPILGFLKVRTKHQENNIVYRRNLSKPNLQKLVHKSEVFFKDLDNFFIQNHEKDVDFKMEYLTNNLKSTLDIITPMQRINNKNAKLKLKPWISKEIAKSIKYKNKLYKYLVKTRFKNIDKFLKYKAYRNKLSKTIEHSKQNYFKDLISKSYKDSKKTWQAINKIIGHQQNKTNLPSQLLYNGNNYTNSFQIANLLNKHFATIGHTNSDKIEFDKISRQINYNNPNTIYFQEPSLCEIGNIIISLKNSKSCGHDNIPTIFIKQINNNLTRAITKLFTESLTTSIYPNCLKIAKVISLHKGGSKDIPNNYRPISILPIINKIFEKIIYNRLISFFNKQNIIQDTQFGFRKGHSTELAVAKFYEDTLINLDNNFTTCAIILDLSKAFDSVNREILLFKLYKYGIRGNIHNLIRSYLKNRTQYIQYNNNNSELTNVNVGVPQGSILSPLLFLILINDLKNCSNFNVINFADDTMLYFKFNKLDNIETLLNKELDKINTWMKQNHLKLNISKTKFMLFSPKCKIFETLKINLKIGEEQIEQVRKTKYLGLILDDKLNWKDHLSHLANKLSRSLGIMFKLRHFVKKETLILTLHSIFITHARYGILCWGRADKSIIKPIETLFDRAIRCINFYNGRHGKTTQLYYQDNILKLKDIYNLELSKFMFKHYKNLLPESFNSYFSLTKTIHSHNTRNIENKLFIPRINKKSGHKSISYLGAQHWNNIPNSLKQNKTINAFSKQYKNYLINQYN